MVIDKGTIKNNIDAAIEHLQIAKAKVNASRVNWDAVEFGIQRAFSIVNNLTGMIPETKE